MLDRRLQHDKRERTKRLAEKRKKEAAAFAIVERVAKRLRSSFQFAPALHAISDCLVPQPHASTRGLTATWRPRVWDIVWSLLPECMARQVLPLTAMWEGQHVVIANSPAIPKLEAGLAARLGSPTLQFWSKRQQIRHGRVARALQATLTEFITTEVGLAGKRYKRLTIDGQIVLRLEAGLAARAVTGAGGAAGPTAHGETAIGSSEGDKVAGSTQGSGIAELWHHISWTNLKRPINCGLLQLRRSTATCSDASAVALEAVHRVGRGPTGARPAAAWKDLYGLAMELDGKSMYKATFWRLQCEALTSLTVTPGVVAAVSIRGAAHELWAPCDEADGEPEEHADTAIVSTQGQTGVDKEEAELGDEFDCHEADAESLDEDDVRSETTARVLEQEHCVVEGPIIENEEAPDIEAVAAAAADGDTEESDKER